MTGTLKDRLSEFDLEERLQMLLDHLAANGSQGIDLRSLNLANARLTGVQLSGADLRHAILSHAILASSDCSHAVLEEADLEGADLAGANLQEAKLGGANLSEALLDEANLSHASLRFAQLKESFLEHASLEGADLWGARMHGASLARAAMRGALLHEADLSGADLTRADLRDANLERANCEGATFNQADLRCANLQGVNFRNAKLQGTQLSDLDLTECEISHVWLSDAVLDNTKLHVEQINGVVGEELAAEYAQAQRAYHALERNFQQLGIPEAASWAYRRKRRMQKLDARKKGKHLAYVADQLVEWVCDYGESIGRVMLSMMAVYIGFALLYGVTGSVMHVEQTAHGPHQVPTHSVLDLMVFSLLAMTTSGSPAVGLEPRSVSVHLLTGIQALFGIFLTGLLGFVLGNRIRR